MTVVALILVVLLSVGLFRGSFTKSVPVTVIADRAGLVMYPNAKVKMNGAQVGKVDSIEHLPGGGAALHLAIDPDSVSAIPANVGAEITSSTVFGSKFVNWCRRLSRQRRTCRAGTRIQGGDKVTVELNTVFEKLVSVLSEVEPAKLNQTLGRSPHPSTDAGGSSARPWWTSTARWPTSTRRWTASTTSSRSRRRSSTPSPTLSPDLLTTAANATRLSDTVVDQQDSLDAPLLSAIGLADIGTDVLTENRQPLSDVVHLLVPTTDLTNQYNPPSPAASPHAAVGHRAGSGHAGATLLQGSSSAVSVTAIRVTCPRWRPKGGPQCTDLPNVGYEQRPPYVVTDIGANQAQYGNQGILLNSEGLKQALFARSTARRAIPHRSACPDEAVAGTGIKVAVFMAVMLMLTAALFAIFAQVRSGPQNTPLRRLRGRVQPEGGRLGPGRRRPVGTVNRVRLEPDNTVTVGFGADRDIVLTAGARPRSDTSIS